MKDYDGVGVRIRFLREGWDRFKNLSLENSGIKLEFDYSSPRYYSKHRDIILALKLWKFIIEEMQEDNPTVRREFLSDFVHDDNQLVKLVATVESLPTSVWWQILWKHNIDFMTFESFLRRIKKEQVEAIHQNYHDLFSDNKIPRVFGWLYRYKNKPTVWGLCQEKLSPKKRYLNKGSWSYNLLDLDFGFNAYPGGEKDDREAVARSATEAVWMFLTGFLSIKNHASDFIVREEGGKYWWFYRKARSNYVFFPDDRVELKTHICPGFWYTILIHLWFWIVSPVLFIVGLKMLLTLRLADPSLGYEITKMALVMSPGLLNPLWLTCALVRFSYERVVASSWQKAIRGWWKDKGGDIFLVVLLILLVLSLVIFIIGVAVPSLVDVFGSLLVVFGLFNTLWTTSVMLMFFGYAIYFRLRDDYWPNFKQYPVCLKIPIALSALYAVYRFFVLYGGWMTNAVKYVATLVASFFAVLYGVILSSWIILFILALPFVFFAIFTYSTLVLSEKTQARIDAYMEKWAKYLCLFLLVAVLVVNLPGGYVGIEYRSVEQLGVNIVLLFSIILFGLLGFMSFAFNPDNQKLSENISLSGDSLLNKSQSLIRKNEWLSGLDKDSQYKQLVRICSIVKSAFDHDEWLTAMKIILHHFSFDLLAKVDIFSRDISYSLSRGLKVPVLMEFVYNPNLSFEEAKVAAMNRKKAEEEQWEKIVLVLKIIFFIPYFSYKAIAKLVEYSKTLYVLYDLFNKRCPDRHRPQIIKIGVAEERDPK